MTFEKLWEDIIDKIEKTSISVPTEVIKHLFLCIEDRRFYAHRGIDYWCTLKALIMFILGIAKGGGSTIEQQLIRTLTGYREYSIRRKFIELILARKLSRKFDKETIINLYLSTCYMGTGIVGIESASQILFQKNSADLSMNEAAVIASLARYPKPKDFNQLWELKKVKRSKYAIYLLLKCTTASQKVGTYRVFSINGLPAIFSENIGSTIKNVDTFSSFDNDPNID